MRRLNLVPKDIKYGPIFKVLMLAKAHMVGVGIGAIALFLVMATTVGTTQAVMIRRHTKAIREEKKDLNKARADAKNLENLSMQYKKTASYLSYVNSLVQKQLAQLRQRKENWGSWGLTLAELKRYIPKRVWLY